MTYAGALRALDARQETRIALGLGRVRAHLKALGDPQERYPVLHVAGTNGKGSTCAILESVLRAAGRKTGLYTSPHLLDVRERIRVSGRPIPKPAFARLLSRALRADPRGRLTYFELLTSVAFQHFAAEKVDVAVLETGLGGRLDATNVARRPAATLITSIGMDHMTWLGGTLPEIAAEKAGILKKGVPAFCPALPAPALRAVRRRARQVGALLTVVRRPWKTERVEWTRNRQVLRGPDGPVALGLLGRAQGVNVALAHAVLKDVLHAPGRAWKRGLARVSWPGRFQVLRRRGKTLILDGAHNPEAMRALARTFAASPWSRGRTRWIIGLMKDKDRRGILRAAAPLLREVVTVRPPSPRALDALELAREARREAPRAHVSVESEPRTALRSWLSDRRAPKTALACGSFYLVGDVLRGLS